MIYSILESDKFSTLKESTGNGGSRRNPNNWTQTDSRKSWIVNRGYTGHECLDAFSIINMNGRVYDPTLGWVNIIRKEWRMLLGTSDHD